VTRLRAQTLKPRLRAQTLKPRLDERAHPAVEHIGDRNMVSDAEGEVHVGEAVTAVYGERAHDAPATTRSSFSASLSRRSRRASHSSTVNAEVRS
jgi:hypothetical protein